MWLYWSRYGRVDILINNAGILRDVSFKRMSEKAGEPRTPHSSYALTSRCLILQCWQDWDMVYQALGHCDVGLWCTLFFIAAETSDHCTL